MKILMRTHTQAMLVMLDVLSTKPYGLRTCSTPPPSGRQAIAAHLALTALEDLGLAGWTPIDRNSRFYRLTPLGWQHAIAWRAFNNLGR